MDLHSNNKYVWILSVQNFTSYRIKIISILAHIQDISQDFATASQEDTTENEGKTSHSPFHIRGVICPQDDLLLRIWALENSLLATSTPQGQTISPSKCTGTICQHMPYQKAPQDVLCILFVTSWMKTDSHSASRQSPRKK